MRSHLHLTGKEQYRFAVIRSLVRRRITNGEAAGKLGVSVRQVKRIKKAFKRNGPMTVIHKLKGKTGNRRIKPEIKETALQQIREKYFDFRPGFATEKLRENHSIKVSPDTVLRWMSEIGLWKPRRNRKTGEYHSWRPRKEYYGEFQQFDGSYHDWFEKRYQNGMGETIETCLLLSVDDATGRITKAEFAPNEGVRAVFEFWKAYVKTNGKPIVIYLDKFSTYKINHKGAEDNRDLMTQFQRVCRSLDIQLINANSPQAKGRVERMFETLQDRLVKEMRLAQVSSPDQGNIFLKDIFIPKFNEKFAVRPAKEGDTHRELTITDKKDFHDIFSIHHIRTINNDFTVQFENNWYQLEELQPTTVRPGEKITVEIWLDTTIHLVLRDHCLRYRQLPERPEKINHNPVILTTHKLNYRPPANHPWKRNYKDKS